MASRLTTGGGQPRCCCTGHLAGQGPPEAATVLCRPHVGHPLLHYSAAAYLQSWEGTPAAPA